MYSQVNTTGGGRIREGHGCDEDFAYRFRDSNTNHQRPIMRPMAIRLGIVEDNALLCHALSQALAGDGFEVIFSVGSAQEALSRKNEAPIDVLIADVHLGEGLTGFDVSLEWQARQPDIGVIYLTSYEDPRVVVGNRSPQVAKNSIHLVKASIVEGTELTEAITRVAAHEGSDIIERSGPLAKLTGKQIETLALLAAGHSNLEIAKRRGITEQSVAISINRLSKALGIPSHLSRNQRVHLARVYLDHTNRPDD